MGLLSFLFTLKFQESAKKRRMLFLSKTVTVALASEQSFSKLKLAKNYFEKHDDRAKASVLFVI